MHVTNTTRGQSLAVPTKDKDGRDLLAVILKVTFEVGPQGQVSVCEEDPPEIDLIDTYHGEQPATSSIRRPSQLFESKPGTDVLLLGHAHPPPGSRASSVDVTLRVGPILKTVRAHGIRVWKKGALGGLAPGPAQPILEPVPLIYELGWGGMDATDPEKKPVGEPRNYVGRGVAQDPSKLVGELAAQLELPHSPAGSSRCIPASFGAIHRHWQPRASYAGTYDAKWQQSRMPLLPEDFDRRFHICVPPDQWSKTPLRGDEPMGVQGATPEGEWVFQLPRLAPGFSSVLQGKRTEHATHLDTVLLDADARRVELTWRAAVPLPRKWEMLERVLVFEQDVI